MMSQPYDYLVAFHAVTSMEGRDMGQNNIATTGLIQNGNSQGKIIHIYWASYDVKRKIVVSEWEYFIKHEKFTGLSSETIDKVKITNQDIESKGVSLGEAIQHFNEAIYRNYIHNNLSFCLVTEGDDILTRILPTDAKEVGIKLPNHFLTYFDILEESKKFYRLPGTFNSLNDYLTVMKIQAVSGNTLCQSETKKMLVLLDRLMNDGHRFLSPKCLNPQYQIISGKEENHPLMFHPQQNNLQWNAFAQPSETQSYTSHPTCWYIRMRGLPFSARESEILDFFRGIHIKLEDIVLGFGSDGRFSGEAYIRFDNESDFKKALSLHLSNMGSRYIEIFETNENDFNRLKTPHFSQRSKHSNRAASDWGHLLTDSVGILRMRGLPYSSTETDIKDFFQGYNLVKDGIKRGMSNGRPSGECYVIFDSKDEAHRAMSKNMERIGSRFIELFISSPRELEIFLNQFFANNHYPSVRETNSNILPDERKRTLMMVGLPFRVTKLEVLKFFSDFDLKEHDVSLLSNESGRFSGNASITFADEREAQRALKTKNLSYIGNRYVELYEYK